MKKIIFHIICITLCLTIIACKHKVTQEELITGAVAIKLDQWREQQVKACQDKIMLEAEKYVDSLLVAISLESNLDTIPKPEKPVKPVKPPFRSKPDSVKVDPIYGKH